MVTFFVSSVVIAMVSSSLEEKNVPHVARKSERSDPTPVAQSGKRSMIFDLQARHDRLMRR